MKTRIISGFFLLVILGGVLYLGSRACLAALLLISLIGEFELCRALKEKGHRPAFPLMVAFTLLWYAALFVWGTKAFACLPAVLLVLILFVLAAVGVLTFPKQSFTDASLCLMGFVYVPALFSSLYFVREQEAGLFYSVLVYLAAWGSDVFAYLAGRAFGKRKLAPELSPKKTVAGAVGGVLGGAGLCLLFAHFTASCFDRSYASVMLLAGLYGAGGALMGQLGDLFASSIKRMTEVKDFGKLIPGHGGILDRFDSVLLAGPLMALVLWALKLLQEVSF